MRSIWEGSQDANEMLTRLLHVLQDMFRRERALADLDVLADSIGTTQIDQWKKINQEAIEGIEQSISCLAATNTKEAAVQVLIAVGHLNAMRVELSQFSPLQRRISAAVRLLQSALPILAHRAQIDLKEYGAVRYGHLKEPWPFAPTRFNKGDTSH